MLFHVFLFEKRFQKFQTLSTGDDTNYKLQLYPCFTHSPPKNLLISDNRFFFILFLIFKAPGAQDFIISLLVLLRSNFVPSVCFLSYISPFSISLNAFSHHFVKCFLFLLVMQCFSSVNPEFVIERFRFFHCQFIVFKIDVFINFVTFPVFTTVPRKIFLMPKSSWFVSCVSSLFKHRCVSPVVHSNSFPFSF